MTRPGPWATQRRLLSGAQCNCAYRSALLLPELPARAAILSTQASGVALSQSKTPNAFQAGSVSLVNCIGKCVRVHGTTGLPSIINRHCVSARGADAAAADAPVLRSSRLLLGAWCWHWSDPTYNCRNNVGTLVQRITVSDITQRHRVSEAQATTK